MNAQKSTVSTVSNKCDHVYVARVRSYYDKDRGCRVVKYHDICIFCGQKSAEMVSWMKDPPRGGEIMPCKKKGKGGRK